MTTPDDDNHIATMAGEASDSVTPAAGTQIWIDGQFVDRSEATISVFDHGLLYGDGCFEGIRIYDGRIFKLRSHLDRLYASAKRIRLEPFYDLDAIEAATRQVVERSGLRNGYIRIVLTRGVGTLGLHPFKCERSSAIIIADAISLYPESMYSEGMAVIVAKRPRIPVACLDPQIKSLNYLNNILAKVEAIDAGVLEAIMLNIDGDVAECTGDNIFVVKDGAISTPDLSAGMLNGITRAYVIEEVAPALGYAIDERRHVLQELMEADEIFLTGTAAEIIGVASIDDVPIGSGNVGPVTTALVAEFRRRVHENAPEN
ncbi:MAG: branched-chain-amino-acid transaminase [Phycisphaerales bacterium]|nr:branched-chain-amino-acid transaminase [Phycisphaerales bacterium]